MLYELRLTLKLDFSTPADRRVLARKVAVNGAAAVFTAPFVEPEWLAPLVPDEPPVEPAPVPPLASPNSGDAIWLL